MKKKLAVIGALSLCLALTACGKDKEEKEDKKTEASTEAATEEKTEATEETVTGNKVETSFFTFTYTDEWEYNAEDNLSEGTDYAHCSIMIPSEDSWGKAKLSIAVDIDNAADFSSSMATRGLDAKKAVVDGDYETKNIGGIDFWKSETNTIYYFGYDEASAAFIEIRIDAEDEYVAAAEAVLDTLEFKLTAFSGTPTPWYWEGTPYSVDEITTQVGSYTITSKLIPLDNPTACYSTFDSRIGVTGDTYYLVRDNGIIEEYSRSGDELHFVKELSTPFEKVDEISGANDGAVYISGYGEDLTMIKDGTATPIVEDTYYVALSPDCSWGVNFFSSPELEKVDVAAGTMSDKVKIEQVSSITHAFVTSNNVFISGNSTETGKAFLLVLDKDFNEVGRLTSDDTTTGYFGSVSAVAETANGYVVVDGNMRDIYFLDKSFALIERVDMTDLMGTNYPWPCQAVTTDDGSVIIICTDDREDGSCDEAVVFQLTGF